MTREAFEQLVADALDDIPEPFVSLMDNVAIVVEDEPPRGRPLFGLYQGVPRTERGPGYTLAMPDRITIFRGPIVRACRNEREVSVQVARTVVHEIAHHFGISDERLTELGWD